jgi:hypothetical protein
MSAKCHVWMASGWQVKTPRRTLGRCSYVFGLLARKAIASYAAYSPLAHSPSSAMPRSRAPSIDPGALLTEIRRARLRLTWLLARPSAAIGASV